MRVLLISAYELGRQPIGVAGPGGILRARGHEVRAVDLAAEAWDPELAAWAERVAISVPMHTAARLACELAVDVNRPVACYGLYAAMCADVATPLAGREPTRELVAWVEGTADPVVDPAPPARDLLPPLPEYARLAIGDELRVVGSVEASQGCVHRCRHCPVPVVYDGRIRIVGVDAVLADARQQVDAGARHLSFADPDFLNGPHHARRVVRALHATFPDLTFDCTVKVEHILRDGTIWPELAAAGCLFVVSAFETVNDAILRHLDKGHTAADAARAVALLRREGIEIRPSWLPFTPWSSIDDIRAIVEFVAEHDLVLNVDPVQYTIRLLVPRGSLLLGRIEVGPWDPERLAYPWASELDRRQRELSVLVETSVAAGEPISLSYGRVRDALELDPVPLPLDDGRPRLTESWFCCAEPTRDQLEVLDRR